MLMFLFMKLNNCSNDYYVTRSSYNTGSTTNSSRSSRSSSKVGGCRRKKYKDKSRAKRSSRSRSSHSGRNRGKFTS